MPEGKKKTYVSFDAGPVTRESGLPGVKLDFNYGARVLLPDDGEYRVRFTDLDTSSILYDAVGRNAPMRRSSGKSTGAMCTAP